MPIAQIKAPLGMQPLSPAMPPTRFTNHIAFLLVYPHVSTPSGTSQIADRSGPSFQNRVRMVCSALTAVYPACAVRSNVWAIIHGWLAAWAFDVCVYSIVAPL